MKKRTLALLLAILVVCVSGCKTAVSTTTPAVTTKAEQSITQTETLTETTTAESEEPETTIAEAAVPVYKDSSWRAKTDSVTLTVASTLQYANVPAYPTWNTDPISRMITNLTGVTLEVKYTGDPDAMIMGSMFETLNTKGDMVDLIVVENEHEINKFIASGEVHAIDELAEQYCPEFWDAFDPMEVENNRSGDGHIYAIRTGYRDDAYYANDSFGVAVPRNMVLKTTVMDAVGGTIPTSVEELEKLLYTVKEKGESLMITDPLRIAHPLDSPVADWMGLTQELVWDGEKVRTPYANGNWLEYFSLMNRWYRDGVLKLPVYDLNVPEVQGFATDEDKKAFLKSNFMTSNPTVCFASTYRMGTGSGVQFREGTKEHDTPLPYHLIQEPLTWQGEMKYTASDNEIGFTSGTSVATMIGKANEPERAMLYLQFLAGEEGSKLTKWGIEGTHYEFNANKEPEIIEKYKCDSCHLLFVEGVDQWAYLYDMNTYSSLSQSENYYYSNSDYLAFREMQLNAERINKKYAAENRDPVLAFAPLSPDHGLYGKYQTIEALWRDAAYDMVTAANEEEVELLWKELQDEIQKLGLSEIESTMTVQYQDALARYQAAGFFTEEE